MNKRRMNKGEKKQQRKSKKKAGNVDSLLSYSPQYHNKSALLWAFSGLETFLLCGHASSTSCTCKGTIGRDTGKREIRAKKENKGKD